MCCFTPRSFFINFPHSGQAIGLLCLLRTVFTADCVASEAIEASDAIFENFSNFFLLDLN